MTSPAFKVLAGVSGASLSSAILALSPVGYWKLDESSGTTATDSSGNGRNGTYSGTYTLQGRNGYATFNGGRVAVADNDNWTISTNSGMSMFALVYQDAAATARKFIFSKGDAPTSWEWALYTNASAVIESVGWDLNGNNRMGETITSAAANGEWQAVAWASPTYSASVRSSLYANSGTPLASSLVTTAGAGSNQNLGAAVHIGWRADNPASQGWTGAIAHAAIFPGRLTDANVGTLMTAAAAEGWI